MYKKILLTVLCALVLSPAFAQSSDTGGKEGRNANKHTEETTYNWFVSVGAGAQVYFGDHDKQQSFGKRIAPALDVAVGKWFSPGIGVRLMYSGLTSKGATKHPSNRYEDSAHGNGTPVKGGGSPHWLEESKYNWGNIHADVLFNLLHLFGDKNLDCKWDLSPYVGIGWAHVYDSPSESSVSGNFGLFASYNFHPAWSVNADARGMIAKDRLDGEVGGRSNDSNLSLSVGVSYKF